MSRLRSLLYESRILIPLADRPLEIERIVTVSMARNPGLDVTGALIGTQDRFAQVLEGPAEAIDTLMSSIVCDMRHADLTVVSDQDILERRFPRWSMAYFGQAGYVSRLVEALGPASPVPREAAALRLLAFMQGMASS